MEKELRNQIQRATQGARALLEREYAEHLEGIFDIRLDGSIAAEPGSHLDAEQRVLRTKLVAAVDHQRASGLKPADAVASYLREAAFTMLNRFVALKMLEARGLVQECVSRGDQSAGFREFTGLAPGLVQLSDHGYRLYIESIFDEIGTEVRVLFDRRDPASMLWPRRQAFAELLAILNDSGIAEVWKEDETIGWVYQYFNGDDERRQMRAESQAPRNSRELAVRNQFFTPRYVVQFLTDNTLGRIWYEMRKGETRLVNECDCLVHRPNEVFLNKGAAAPEAELGAEENLSQEEVLKKTVYVPFRAKKDPRDIRVLDPACGSGHFLLYSFDRLLTIYEEAWSDESSPVSEITGRSLHADYPDIEMLCSVMPVLILRHNLHGIDIDARCAQIAALSLWMRAQRAYKDFGIARDARSAIQKTNIVVAEPMPGDRELRLDFLAALEQKLGQLVERVFERMALAGEAGSLLRIGEDIREAVRENYGERGDLFRASDEERWRKAEMDVLGALRRYAERELNGRAYQRRLFAEDAVRGFGFVDICGLHYDVVLMNPPFGEPTTRAGQYLDSAYVKTKHDLYAAFTERGLSMLNACGVLGAITSRTGLFLKRSEWWRSELLLKRSFPLVLADLGSGVLDSATVETASYVLVNYAPVTSWFFKLDGSDDKDLTLRSAFRAAVQCSSHPNLFVLSAPEFRRLPECKWLYWLNPGIRQIFLRMLTLKELGFVAGAGLQTNDDFRFVRASWEVPRGSIGRQGEWNDFYKGGEYSPYFDDIHLVVRWGCNGYAIKQHTISLGNSPSRHVVNENLYFKDGLGYINISSVGFSPQVLPSGVIFSIQGQYLGGDDRPPPLSLLASSVAGGLLDIINPGRHYQAGQVQLLPLPPDARAPESEVWAYRIVTLKQEQATWCEESRDFVVPLVLSLKGSVDERLRSAKERIDSIGNEIVDLQAKVDNAAVASYGLDEDGAEYLRIEARSARAHPGTRFISSLAAHFHGGMIAEWCAYSVLSYAVGVAFGRWDIRYIGAALTSRDWRKSLPTCPPGMLATASELPADARTCDPNYTLEVAWGGLLVDDEGHSDDLAIRISGVLDIFFRGDGTDSARKLVWIASGGRYSDVREWHRHCLFAEHIAAYTKSRRRAPIYWQLAIPSVGYSVWLCYHRLTKDSCYKILNDYAGPKLQHEERKLVVLVQGAGANPTASQRKQTAEQESLVAELREFCDEVARIAPLWNPDLNDGVIINFAPLWRLVPQHKAWQKECKDCWDKLVAGDYDWAHLAMHLWPERVVPKCAEDRSLAIAHGLEEVFWVEGSNGKWQKRKVDQSKIDQLIAERTSPAVKDALKSLLEAPAPSASKRQGPGSRKSPVGRKARKAVVTPNVVRKRRTQQ